MNCPKCHADMEIVHVCGIEIDRCIRCRGIWFDQQEQSQLKCARGTHKADIGHQAIGEYYNTIRDINCPRCNVPMKEAEMKRVRVRIQYEQCEKCEGLYFDAGEFRDFAEPTIIEFVKEIFARFTGKSSVK